MSARSIPKPRCSKMSAASSISTRKVVVSRPSSHRKLLTYTVDEGNKYTFGKMAVESQVPDLQSSALEGLLTTKDGETFNAQKIEETQEAMTKELGNLGYAFVDIDTQYNRDPAARTVGLKYVVKEGPRVYVDNINIHGNVRTLDEVIRREFRVAEGDPYNASKIKRSQERINNLGFFKKVDIKNMPADEPDRVDIDVGVEEKSTGELTLGAGFSTGDGPLADIGISERNLLGRGQLLRANFTVSAVRQDIDAGFTEPYFLDKNLAAGFDIFKLKRNGSSSRANRAYDSDSIGFTLRASYPLTEHLTHAVRYTLRSDEITDIDPLASRFIKDQAGKTTASIVGHTFTYDTRDSRFDPTEGYYIRFNQDFAGLGADSKFIKNDIRGGYYVPTLNNKWILQFSLRGGKIFPLAGRDVEINNRFFVGGNEIRGFSNDGIGPRDSLTKDVLGGNTFYAGTVEYTFPLGLADELGFSGSVFMDAGSLFDVDDHGPGVLDEASLRSSVGVGLSWKSPLGPVRINLAQALTKESFDETEILRFSFGTRF
ncbi:MAG: outer membrane protein assembly factor BamA [Proteobacteria bacterium]|nr:outer membrane protein assembly factor BamA [Pseudomonadota bacterium]